MKELIAFTALLAVTCSLTAIASAGPAQDTLLAQYEAEAKAADPAFAGFSADRGKALFEAVQTTGKPDTPSCTTCHTKDPHNAGQTRVGKVIEPMAVSVTPTRFTDYAKTEKWFGRNCNTVIGRACTPLEKGDFVSFMISQ